MENTFDSALGETAQDEFETLMAVKQNIIGAIGRKKFVDILVHIIDESPYINFTSERARKYINPQRPELTLVIDEEKFTELHPESTHLLTLAKYRKEGIHDDGEYQIYTDAKNQIIQDAIITPYAAFVSDIFSYILQRPLENEESLPFIKEMVGVEDEKDLEGLAKRVNNITTMENDELMYIFSITSGYMHNPSHEEVLNDNVVTLNLLL